MAPLASFYRCQCRQSFPSSRVSSTPPVADTAESAADVSPPCHHRQQRYQLPSPTSVASSLPVWRRQKRLRCFYAVDFVVQISLMSSSSLVVVVAGRLATITRPIRNVRLTAVASDVVDTAVVRLLQSQGEIWLSRTSLGRDDGGWRRLASKLLSNDVISAVRCCGFLGRVDLLYVG